MLKLLLFFSWRLSLYKARSKAKYHQCYVLFGKWILYGQGPFRLQSTSVSQDIYKSKPRTDSALQAIDSFAHIWQFKFEMWAPLSLASFDVWVLDLSLLLFQFLFTYSQVPPPPSSGKMCSMLLQMIQVYNYQTLFWQPDCMFTLFI